MTKARKRKRQQGCNIAKIIHAIEKVASTAMAIYSAIEPVIKAIVRNEKKTK
jgi:hypothetical protein